MKVLVLLITIILATTTLSGQNCKYISNTVSGMDGSRLVITNPQIFSRNQAEVWAKLDQDSLIILTVVLKEFFPVSIRKGDQIIFGKENKEIMTLVVMQDASRPLSSEKPLSVYCRLEKSDFERISGVEIDRIRLQVDDGWIDLEATTKKGRNAISHVLGCIVAIL